MNDSIGLDVLWNMHVLSEENSKPALYVNSLTQHAEQELRDLFYRSGFPQELLEQYDRSLGEQALLLTREIQTHLPVPRSYNLADKIIAANLDGINIVHHSTPSWANQTKDTSVIHWLMELSLGNTPLNRMEGDLSLPTLSSSSQETVSLLDGLSIEIAYRRYIDHLSQLVLDPAFKLPPRKYRVCVSYRKKTGSNLAKSIYNSVNSYASNSLFDAYLDEHKLCLGDWENQIFKALETSNIFVPIVTPGYAEDGTIRTISAKELDRAFELQREHGFSIAPVFTIEPENDKISKLTKLHALMLGERSLEEAQKELNSFLRIMVRTVAKQESI